MTNPLSNSYRADIDGLRALAVLSILAYHLNKSWLPGGYIGVDVFFVISGYLITGIIDRSVRTGTFTFREFYIRRIRRIAPAFFVVLLSTLAFGAALLLPSDLTRLAQSAMFSSLGAANLYFWKFLDDDYFASSSDQEPLLHMWSLGVEEQFYLLWPALLMLLTLTRRRNLMLAAVVVGAVASYLLAEHTNLSFPKFSYFMLPTRAGELLAGSALALAMPMAVHATFTDRVNWRTEGMVALGLVLVAIPLIALSDTTPFPGLNAVAPCAGTLLLLGTGRNSRIKKWLLENRLMVAVGLMSYSVYLWHWPILAFGRYFFEQIDGALAALAFIATMLLSWMTYRFIEQPGRTVGWTPFRSIGTFLALPAAAALGFGSYVVSTNGLKSWIETSRAFADGARELERYTAPATQYAFNCQSSKFAPDVLGARKCIIGAPGSSTASAFVWGDSHASHYLGLLDIVGKSEGLRIRNAEVSSCPPVFQGQYSYGRYINACLQFHAHVRKHVAASQYKVIVLGANWPAYDQYESFRDDLVSTIDEIRAQGRSVVLLGTVPSFSSFNRECSLRWQRLGITRCTGSFTTDQLPEIDAFLQRLSMEKTGVSYLTAREVTCELGQCRAFQDGLPLYYDRAHLSMDGSIRLGKKLVSKKKSARWGERLRGSEDLAIRTSTFKAER